MLLWTYLTAIVRSLLALSRIVLRQPPRTELEVSYYLKWLFYKPHQVKLVLRYAKHPYWLAAAKVARQAARHGVHVNQINEVEMIHRLTTRRLMTAQRVQLRMLGITIDPSFTKPHQIHEILAAAQMMLIEGWVQTEKSVEVA